MRDRAGKREAILRAVETLLQGRRVHELTMDAVAARAGVSKGTLYLHFQNKDDLLFQLATEGFDQLCESVSRTPREGDFGARLAFMGERISDFFERRRTVVRMIQDQEGRMGGFPANLRGRWLERRRKLVRAVADVLEEGSASGVVRGDVSGEVLATLLLGMMRARGRDFAHVPGERPPVATVMAVFLEGAGGASVGRAGRPPA